MDRAQLMRAIEEAEDRVSALLLETSEDDSNSTQVELRSAAQVLRTLRARLAAEDGAGEGAGMQA